MRPDTARAAWAAIASAALLAPALGWAPASPASAEPRAAQVSPALPAGRWMTYANGDDILALAWDDGRLWAGARHGGLVRWDPLAGAYEQFLRPQDPLAGNTVYDIAIDGAGRKWLATDRGLTMLDDKGNADRADDRWLTYNKANSEGGLLSDDVRALAVDGTRLWIGLAQELDPLTGTWGPGGLARLETAGTPDTSDDTWMPPATFENTLRGKPDGTVQLGLVSDNINDLALSPKGGLWVATGPHRRLEDQADTSKPKIWAKIYGGVSFRDTVGTVNPADDKWTANHCDGDAPAVSCQVQALAVGPSDRLWIGQMGRGLRYQSADVPIIVDDPSFRFEPSEGLGGNTVNAIAFGPQDVPALKNTVWMATQCSGACLGRKGGLSILDHGASLLNRSDDRWDLSRGRPYSAQDGLARDRAQALIIVGGTAWIGTGPLLGVGGGVGRMAVDNGTFASNLITACSQPGCTAPPSNFMTDLAIGPAGTRWAGHVWVASGSRSPAARRFGSGLLDLDTKGTALATDDVWKAHTTVSSDPDGKAPWSGLPGNNVHAVLIQGDRVWSGSATSDWGGEAYTDGGLALHDGTRWTARTVANTKKGNTPGLRSAGVTALAAGCSGELYVATGSPWDSTGTGLDVLKPGSAPHDLAADTWTAHSFPQLPSNNLADVAVDCQAGNLWVAGPHHLSPPDMFGMNGGRWQGGGVGQRPISGGSWTRHDTTNGMQSFGDRDAKGEVIALLPGPEGSVWAGAYGTKDLSTAALINQRPYFTAQLNTYKAGAWTHQPFASAGWISAIARDPDGRLWLGTSRNGLAREAIDPEGWRTDRKGGGLLVHDGTAWHTLSAADTGLPSNDISAVAVAAEGDVWVATDGWGLARFMKGAAEPTPTPTLGLSSPTPTPTVSETPATPTPTVPEVTPTPGGSPSPSATGPSPTSTRGPTTPGGPRKVYLPFLHQRRPR